MQPNEMKFSTKKMKRNNKKYWKRENHHSQRYWQKGRRPTSC